MRSAMATRSSVATTRGSTAVAAASPAASTAGAAAAPRVAVAVTAGTSAKNESGSSRRALLASLAGSAAAFTAAQLSSPALPRAAAAIGVWDGSSAASGSCAVGPDGDACRARTLAKDFGKGTDGYIGSIKGSSGLATNTNSIPIPAVQGGAYAADTRALAASIREYLALAPSDASRVPKGKALRKAGAVWAAKYAPGGSARLKSARRCYISVDALQGHLAANGAAPYPASKAAKLLAGLDDVEELLSKGQ